MKQAKEQSCVAKVIEDVPFRSKCRRRKKKKKKASS